jgi:hypothetical protein
MQSARWLKISLGLQVALAVYFQAVVWFALGAWNRQGGGTLLDSARQGDLLGALEFAVPFLLPVLLTFLAYARGWTWLLWVSVAGYGGWAAMQILSWWVPYLFGADARARRNAQALAGTTKLLPSFPNHPAPDGMHFVLDVLLFAVVATLLVGLLRRRPSS